MSGFDNIIKLVSDDKEYRINKYLIKNFPNSLLYKVLFENTTITNNTETDFVFMKDKVMYLDIDPVSLDIVIKYLRGYPTNSLINYCTKTNQILFIHHDLCKLNFDLAYDIEPLLSVNKHILNTTPNYDVNQDITNTTENIEAEIIKTKNDVNIIILEKPNDIVQENISKKRKLKGTISNSITIL